MHGLTGRVGRHLPKSVSSFIHPHEPPAAACQGAGNDPVPSLNSSACCQPQDREDISGATPTSPKSPAFSSRDSWDRSVATSHRFPSPELLARAPVCEPGKPLPGHTRLSGHVPRLKSHTDSSVHALLPARIETQKLGEAILPVCPRSYPLC